MRYKLLGKSGLRVSELCLGTMTFGEEWGWGASRDQSRKVFERFVEAGGNFIDTANRYTEGTSEKLTGEFIAAEREKYVLATKYTLSMNFSDPNGSGNSRKNMIQSLEASLKRLNTDYIDLFWLHAWDFLTPIEEIMRGLDDLVRAGKVLYIGISDTPAWIVSRANTMAEFRGWSQFIALQIKYSLAERTVERELTPMARELDLAVTPWGILGGGVLTGKYNEQGLKADASGERLKETPVGTGALTEQNFRIAAEVASIAAEIGSSSSQVAINWLRQQPGNIIPILGARTEAQVVDNLGCLDFELTGDQIERLNTISQIELGFPHDFLKIEHIQNLVFGDQKDKIDNHRLKK